MSISQKPLYPTPVADPGATTISLAQFYGELIDAHLQAHPEHRPPRLHLVHAALGIGLQEFRLGVEWCIEQGIIKRTLPALSRFPDGFGRIGIEHHERETAGSEPEHSEPPLSCRRLAFLVFMVLFVMLLLGYYTATSGDRLLIAVTGATLATFPVTGVVLLLENGFRESGRRV